MNYKEVMKYLDSLDFFGIKLGLERTKYLMKKLGNPEESLKVIHVAGTNGKGSVCYMIGSILEAAGYNVGVYTSPHLVDFRERITINGSMISGQDIADMMGDIIPIADGMENDPELGHPTYFEITTAAALCYFKRQKVDFVVLEIGLGGRLDATNVVNPLVSVITNVTMEHSDYLGNDVPVIALEKAGIIKKNSMVVTAATDKALDVVLHKSERLDCKVSVVGKDITFTKIKSGLDGQFFEVKSSHHKYELKMHVLGEHQLINAACAISAVESLKKNGVGIKPQFIKRGLEEVKLEGRFEITGRSPFVILDGAHNAAGMRSTREAVSTLFKDSNIILVIGICTDKDIPAMMKEIASVAETVVVTAHSLQSRATDPKILSKEARKYSKNVIIKSTVKGALEYARSIADRKDVILVTGSLYLVGDVKKLI